MFYSGCHGNQVSIATRYEADAYCPNEPLYQMWTEYKTKELLMYHCGCHGNLVTIATSYVAVPIVPNMDSIRHKTKELPSKMYLTQTH